MDEPKSRCDHGNSQGHTGRVRNDMMTQQGDSAETTVEKFNLAEPLFDEDGEFDEGTLEVYADRLLDLFANSPEGQQLLDAGDDICWTYELISLGFNYIGVSPATMEASDFKEILFELFPRKCGVEPEEAGQLIKEFRAFWQFIQREFRIPAAKKMLALLGDDAEPRLRRELGNSANFGMAKGFMSMGRNAGFDVSSEAGLATWVAEYNRQLTNAPAFPAGLFEPDPGVRQATKAPAAKLKEARRNKRKAEKAARRKTRK